MKKENMFGRKSTLMLALTFSGILMGCEMELVENSDENEHHLKLLPLQTETQFFHMRSRGGQVDVLGTANDGKLQHSILNRFGIEESTTSQPFNTEEYNPYGSLTVLPNGNALICSKFSNVISEVDADGKIARTTTFRPLLHYSAFGVPSNSLPFLSQDGHVFISTVQDGLSTFQRESYIHEFNSSLALTDSFEIPFEAFGDFLDGLYIFHKDDSRFWVLGHYDKYATKAITKSFLALYNYENQETEKLILLDEDDDSEYDRVHEYIIGVENEVTFFTHARSYYLVNTNAQSSFEVLQANTNLRFNWRTRVDLGTLNITPFDLTTTQDGGFLISGWCTPKEDQLTRPFCLKLNSEGNQEFVKIFDIPNSLFRLGIEVDGIHYQFLGTSSAFGANAVSKTFTLRTDLEGNFEE